jgi:hypothetical protein
MTSLVLVGACAFRHELMAMAVVQIRTAANIANVDPLTKAGFSMNQIDAMSRLTTAMATSAVVRPFRVVIDSPFSRQKRVRVRRQTDEECGEAL